MGGTANATMHEMSSDSCVKAGAKSETWIWWKVEADLPLMSRYSAFHLCTCSSGSCSRVSSGL